MLTYPVINPVALAIGPLKIHWYGLMYLLAFSLAWLLARWRSQYYQLAWTPEQISDLIFYSALGVILGGRMGYMIFYNMTQLLHQPLSLFAIWEGGMSFHGGLIGVVLAVYILSRKINKSYLEIADFAAPLVPLGIGAGRAGNFINGELWGRVTDVPWAMIFPGSDGQARHPSQLYELGLEGLVLFSVVWFYARKPRPSGCVAGVFLMGYALCRILGEYFRQPDVQLGFIAFDWLTMGQLLSVPMLLAGIILWGRQQCKST